MLAVSIKQPWAWLIMEGFKTVENRRWAPKKMQPGQRIAIHASKGADSTAFDKVASILSEADFVRFCRAAKSMHRGAIIGTVEFVGIFPESAAIERKQHYAPLSEAALRWYEGSIGWVFANPQRLRTEFPCSGQLGFWEVDHAIRYAMFEGVSDG